MANKSKIKMGSNKSLGIVFFIVFLIIAFWPLVHENPIRVWSAIISIIFLFLSLTNSKILTPLNILWFKFGLLLGMIISPIVMGIVFFLVVTPIGFLMSLMGKDVLRKRYENNKNTYWIKRNKSTGTMKKQF